MGCCVSGGEEKTDDREPLAQSKPKYSWEKEDRLDRSQLIVSKQDCERCQIFVLDHTSAVTVHGCTECDIVLGPCGGSVFVRQCTGCTMVVASQQFRGRDCKRCSIYLHCKSQPVIESCSKLKFGCFQAYYPELRDQFQSADLHPFHNQWSQVHNFTGGSDWSFAQETTPPIKTPTEELSGCGLTFQRGQSTVPHTVGSAARPTDTESCVVALVGEEREKKAREFLLAVQDKVVVVQTYHVQFREQEAQASFDSHDHLLEMLTKGPCIILELAGDSCQQVCHSSLAGVSEEMYHVSSSGVEGERERDALANYLASSLTM